MSSTEEGNVKISHCKCADASKHDATCFFTFILNINAKMEDHAEKHLKTTQKIGEHSRRIEDLEDGARGMEGKIKDVEDIKISDIKR